MITDSFSSEQIDSFAHNLKVFNSKKFQTFFAFNRESLTPMTVKEAISLFNANDNKIIFAFFDPNSQSQYPSWILRNFLALLSLKLQFNTNNKDKTIEIVALRDHYKNGVRDLTKSLILNVNLVDLSEPGLMKTIGWERNEKQLFQPRIVDMSTSMNKEKLVETAVSLNLKLMKWRIAPNINLDIIKSKKCLLLGSGTLGCNVARCLMAWGVETITFLDNSKVSYSNPVRQSLFTFEDSMSGPANDNYKSTKAAANLKLIYPGVDAKAVVLSIPMPGHFVGEKIVNKIRDDVIKLESLIDEHDVIFLLMDTRESRWLPTLLAAAKKKLVINSALGFDSFLVMRHGVKQNGSDVDNIEVGFNFREQNSKIPSSQLGCYFCNDIVAPGNSTLDRTLDQQCTVSRPGLSMIASALAVELMVTVFQHPLKEQAYSFTNYSSDFDNDSAGNESCLGIVPHQVISIQILSTQLL
jgi:ubiquitin-like modifier-activating enzyme ATG7